jgi:hypothetical protein
VPVAPKSSVNVLVVMLISATTAKQSGILTRPVMQPGLSGLPMCAHLLSALVRIHSIVSLFEVHAF